MADRFGHELEARLKIIIEAKADVHDAVKRVLRELGDLDDAQKGYADSNRDLAESLEKTNKSIGDLDHKIEEKHKTLEKDKRTTDETTQSMHDLRRAHEALARSVARGEITQERYRKLQREIQKAETDLQGTLNYGRDQDKRRAAESISEMERRRAALSAIRTAEKKGLIEEAELRKAVDREISRSSKNRQEAELREGIARAKEVESNQRASRAERIVASTEAQVLERRLDEVKAKAATTALSARGQSKKTPDQISREIDSVLEKENEKIDKNIQRRRDEIYKDARSLLKSIKETDAERNRQHGEALRDDKEFDDELVRREKIRQEAVANMRKAASSDVFVDRDSAGWSEARKNLADLNRQYVDAHGSQVVWDRERREAWNEELTNIDRISEKTRRYTSLIEQLRAQDAKRGKLTPTQTLERVQLDLETDSAKREAEALAVEIRAFFKHVDMNVDPDIDKAKLAEIEGIKKLIGKQVKFDVKADVDSGSLIKVAAWKTLISDARGYFRGLGDEINKSSSQIAAFDNLLRGLVTLLITTFIGPLIAAASALAGALLAVGSAAIAAGAALGGALTAGIAQALPAVGLLAAVISRVKNVFQAVQQANLKQQQDSYKGAKAANTQASALDGVKNAQEGLANAQRQALKAQENLNKAREEARKKLQDLLLAERSAVLAATESQNALDNAVNTGQGALAVEGATIKRDQSKLDLSRTTSELRGRQRAGIEGSPEVKQAKEQLADANRAVEAARRGLEAARRTSSVAEQNITAAGGKLNFLIGQMSDAERKLYRALVRLQTTWHGFARTVSAPLIESFATAANRINGLLKNTGIRRAFTELSTVLANGFNKIFADLTSPETIKFFLGFIKDLEANIPIVTDMLINFGQFFLNLGRTSGPVLTTILEWLRDISQAMRDFTESRQGKNFLAKLFDDGLRALKSFGGLLYSIGNLILAIMGPGGGVEGGIKLIDLLAGAINNLAKEIRKPGSPAREFVNTLIDLSIVLAKALGPVLEGFAKILNDLLEGNLGPSGQQLIEDMGRIITEVFIPAIATAVNFIDHLISIFHKLFFELGGVSDILRKLAVLLIAMPLAFSVLFRLGTVFKPFITAAKDALAFLLARKWKNAALDAAKGVESGLVSGTGPGSGLWSGVTSNLTKLRQKMAAIMGKKIAVDATVNAGGEAGGAAAGSAAGGAASGGILSKLLGRGGGAAAGGMVLGGAPEAVGAGALEGGLAGAGGAAVGVAAIIAAAIAAIVALIAYAGKLDDVWKALKDGASEVFDGIRDGVDEVKDPLDDLFKSLFGDSNDFLAVLSKVAKFLGTVLGGAAVGQIKKFASIVGDAFRAAGKIIGGWITTLEGAFELNPKKILSGVGKIGTGIGIALTAPFRAAIRELGGFGKTIGGKVYDIMLSMAESVLNGADKIASYGEKIPIIGKLFGKGRGKIDEFLDTIRSEREKIRRAAQTEDEKDAERERRRERRNNKYPKGGFAGAAGTLTFDNKDGAKKVQPKEEKKDKRKPSKVTEEQAGLFLSTFDENTVKMSDEITKKLSTFWSRLKRATKDAMGYVLDKFRDVKVDGGKYIDRMVDLALADFSRLADGSKNRLGRFTTNVTNAMKDAADAVYKGMKYIINATNDSLGALGSKKISISLAPFGGDKRASGGFVGVRRAVGGWIGNQGERGRDMVHAVLGRGEAVLNWAHQKVVDPALRAVYGYGLAEMFQKNTAFHAGGPEAPGYAGGGLTGPFGSGAGFIPVANFAKRRFGLSMSAGRTNHNLRTTTGNISDHSWGGAGDFSNGVLTPQEDAFNAFWKTKAPQVVKQLIWRNKDQFRGFTVGGHEDHVHLALLRQYAMDAARMAKIISRASRGLKLDDLLRGGTNAAATEEVKRVVVRGTGAVKRATQAAVDKVRNKANDYINSKAGAQTLDSGAAVSSSASDGGNAGATTFGGPADPGTGSQGYKGDDLNRNWRSFAELGNGRAMGDLPYKQKIKLYVPSTKKSMTLVKRDIGGGGGPIGGYPRQVDIWYKAAQALGLPQSWAGVVRWTKAALGGFLGFAKGGSIRDFASRVRGGSSGGVGAPVPNQRIHAATHQTLGLDGYPAYDYMDKAGTRVLSPVDGKVTRLSGHDPKNGPTNGPHGPFGYSVYIEGGGRKFFLTHLGSRNVKVGDSVRKGQKIGTIGDYAKWGGADHVHMGINGPYPMARGGILKKFAAGGVLDGGEGTPIPIIAHAGEWILNKVQQLHLAKLLGVGVDSVKQSLGFKGGPKRAFKDGGSVELEKPTSTGNLDIAGVRKVVRDFNSITIGGLRKQIAETTRILKALAKPKFVGQYDAFLKSLLVLTQPDTGLLDLIGSAIEKYSQKTETNLKLLQVGFKRVGNSLKRLTPKQFAAEIDPQKIAESENELQKTLSLRLRSLRSRWVEQVNRINARIRRNRRTLFVQEIKDLDKEIAELKEGKVTKEDLKKIKEKTKERALLVAAGDVNVKGSFGQEINKTQDRIDRFEEQIDKLKKGGLTKDEKERKKEIEARLEILKKRKSGLERAKGRALELQSEATRAADKIDELDQKIAEAEQARFEAAQEAFQANFERFSKRIDRRETVNNAKKTIAETLGNVDGVREAADANIKIADDRRKLLQIKLEAAKSKAKKDPRWQEMVDDLSAQIEEANANFVQAQAEALQTAIDAVNNAANNAEFWRGIRERGAALRERAGDRLGAINERRGISQSKIESATQQRNQLQDLLGQAAAQGNTKLVEDLTKQIADLDMTIKEEKVALQEATWTYRQVATEIITGISSRTTGLFGQAGQIFSNINSGQGLDNTESQKQILIAIGGALRTELSGIISSIQQSIAGNEFGSTGSGILGQLIAAAGTSPSAFANALITLGPQIAQFESALGDTERGAFAALIDSLTNNTVAVTDNTSQLEQLNAPDQNQSWTSTAWQVFRQAIFNGSGGLLPQFDVPQMHDGGMVRKGGLFELRAGEKVSTPESLVNNKQDVNVTINEAGQTVDPTALANRLAFTLKHSR